jgi:homoserine kinase type II
MYLGNWRLFTLAPFRLWSTMPCYRAGALDTHRHMTHYARPDFELAELMHEYRLGSVRNVRRVEGGTVNKNWIVRTTKETVVVRSVAQELSCSDIKFEHSFIRALGRCSFPYQLPHPLRTRTGRTFVMKNGAYVWLYNYIEGSNCEPSREEIIAEIARAMATAHQAARRFSLRNVKYAPIALQDLWLVRMLRHWQLKLCKSSDQRCRFFTARVQECLGILEALRCTRYHALPRFPIHGDLHRANVVFSGGRLRGIIDFGHCCSDTSIRDITIALRNECANSEHRFELDLEAARSFVRIYHQISPLSPEEIELIPAVAAAESADLFWWGISQIASKQTKVESIDTAEQSFKSLQWYYRHHEEIARALLV